MKEDHYHLRERVRIAGESLWSLIFIVLGVGLCLGLTTNLLAAYILASPNQGLWLAASGAMTVALVLWFVLRINSKGHDFSTTVELMLPFRVTVNQAEIIGAKQYPVTCRAQEMFGRLMRDGGSRSMFLRDWHTAWRERRRPFQGFVRTCVTDLQCYLIVETLREYCKQTLTQKAIFGKHGWKPMNIPTREWPTERWPEQLRENIYLKCLKGAAFKRIHLPEGVRLTMAGGKVNDRRELTSTPDITSPSEGRGRGSALSACSDLPENAGLLGGLGDEEVSQAEASLTEDATVREERQRMTERAISREKQSVTLSSAYGNVSVIWSSFQVKVREDSREGSVIHKYCGPWRGQEVWLAKFTLQIHADFGGWRIFGNYFKLDFFPWVVGFIECLKGRFDWDACLERDLERMVVELSGQVKTLLDRQPESNEAVVLKGQGT